VSFRYNDGIGIPGDQVGFIAEQVNTIDPRLVVFDASNTPFSVKYENLTAILAKALQEIAAISGAFKANLIAWLADATNGIHDIYATVIHATTGHFSDELCVGSTCVTPTQFQAMVAAAGQSQSASPSSSPTSPAPDSPAAGSAAGSSSSSALSSTTASTSPTVEEATSTSSSNSDATSSLPLLDPAPPLVPSYNDASTTIPSAASSTPQ
jgi:hypothetical protein